MNIVIFEFENKKFMNQIVVQGACFYYSFKLNL